MISVNGVTQTRIELATHDTDLKADIGDYSGQENLQTLLAALGIPDTSAKPLYTCIITDRLDHGTYGLDALHTDIAAIPTVMVGTDSAFLAAVGGALTDAAAVGEVTESDTVMQYVKQIINELTGAAGVDVWAGGAAPANTVSIHEVIQQIYDDVTLALADVTGINGEAMRGTDLAFLASVGGLLNDAAAAGDPTDADTAIQYLKQLVNVLVGGDGVAAWTAAGVPGNGVSIHEVIRQIYDDVTLALADTSTDGVVLGTKVAAFKKLIGEDQIATTTEELNQVAATYDLFTGTTNPVFLTTLSVKMPTENVANVTSIAIQTDDATVGEIISAADGDVAKLLSEAEIVWTGRMRINTDTKIQLVLAGAAHGTTYPVTITAECKAIVDGGYLAESA